MNTQYPTEVQIVTVLWNIDGKRFDAAARILSANWFSPELPRAIIQEAIKDEAILLQGAPATPGERVSKGDKISFTEAFFQGVVRNSERVQPEGEEPVVIHQNEWFIVLYKPASWLTHGVSEYQEEASLEDWLLSKKLISGDMLNNGRVHRLDRNTSGIILYAKTEEAQHDLKALFQRREVKKTYIALTEGNLPELEGTINAPIMRRKGSFKRFVTEDEHSPEAKPAETSYRVIARTPDHDLVLLTPKTGRTHQIRVHMQHLGHPLVGDSLYGGKKTHIERQFLHAWTLEFRFQAENYHFTAPLAQDLKKLLLILDEQTLTRYDNEALQSIGLKQRKSFFSLFRGLNGKSQ